MAHLYDSRVGKVFWFVRRFGYKELCLKPLRMMLAPILVRRLPRRTLTYQRLQLDYCYHAYNTTWANERCVEVPVARNHVGQHSSEEVLEVGNVLSHYGPIRHQVLDKYERGNRVINQDIVEFQPDRRYRLIISISTFEHIGFDDAACEDGETSLRHAIAACVRWLQPNGRLVITVPIGYNPALDNMIRTNELPASSEVYLRRASRREWVECPKPVAIAQRYGKPWPYANAILIAEFAASISR